MLRGGAHALSFHFRVSLANCKDAYFEVEVNRATSPYDKTHKYHITATDSSRTVSTPQPRELYVEHSISALQIVKEVSADNNTLVRVDWE